MSEDPRVIDKGWDALPAYADKPGDGDDAVTLSISTTPGEWLVNTTDSVVVPMSMMEVVEALRAQRLTERSLVWRAGMQEWSPVEKVPQLKLAARLPSVMPESSATGRRSSSTLKPPPKPARPASVPSQAAVVPPSAPTATSSPLRSHRETLPFGFPAPASPSSALHLRPTPRPAVPPPAADEPEVLAVYERPAATISFNLEPDALPLETLAPTTTDSAPRRASLTPPRRADLSVVAARDFRQAQQFSKRLILLSSVGSAAVASLLTLWLSRGPAPPQAPTPTMPPVAAAAPAPSPLVVAPLPAPEPVPSAQATTEPSAKPKAKRKTRAWKPPVKPAAPAAEGTDTTPKPEANPYDVQLEEDDASAAKPPSASHGSGLESESPTREETATTAPTPGF